MENMIFNFGDEIGNYGLIIVGNFLRLLVILLLKQEKSLIKKNIVEIGRELIGKVKAQLYQEVMLFVTPY
jgi:hypothetical protein